MNNCPGPSSFDISRFGIGQSVTCKEGLVLMRGQDHYTDDLSLEGQAYMAVVRSPIAHGTITADNLDEVRGADGVLGAWSGAELKAVGYSWSKRWAHFVNRDGTPYIQTECLPMALDKVRFVGEPAAFVVAETEMLACHVAELAEIEIDALPTVTDMNAAAGVPQLHDKVAGNVVLDFLEGDVEAAEGGFAKAAHVDKVALGDSRVVINPLELRSYLGSYDAGADHFTLRTSSQVGRALRNDLSRIMGFEPEKLTVLTEQVDGSFCIRILAFPEQVFVLHAAREIGRPVKWLEEHTPSFLSDNHGRATDYEAELALDDSGNFLALQISGYGDIGGYVTCVGMMPPTGNIVINVCSQYLLPALDVAVNCVLTNTAPVGAYRGAGRQCGDYIIERLIELAAAVSGIDRMELRRTNQLRPEESPYTAKSSITHDCGDFTAVMDEALEAVDYSGFEAPRAEARSRDKLLSIGIGCFLEANNAITREMGGTRFEANGEVIVISGTLDSTANDIELADGRVYLVSTGEGINLIELAEHARNAMELPAGLPESRDAAMVTDGVGVTFPNGCHVCEVEIDEAPGVARVVRYTMVNDIGVVVKPPLLEAQCHGGVVQGIGPGSAGKRGLRRERPDALRFVYRLGYAARRRRTVFRCPSSPGEDGKQPWGEGGRRIRLCRLAHQHQECGGQRAVSAGDRPCRHACNPRESLAPHLRSQAQRGMSVARNV